MIGHGRPHWPRDSPRCVSPPAGRVRVGAPKDLIEDACQTAWAILLHVQPNRYSLFAWLRVVAIHEAYRLIAIERREARFQPLRPQGGLWSEHADAQSLDHAVEALEALKILAS